ncbi:MAG TPA: hypothetical protein VG407_14495 [Caulobacteraceae bacterium]|jgi:hypothetical protein|nr:hypothetical protein [Caulobacteraceae bacterium]
MPDGFDFDPALVCGAPPFLLFVVGAVLLVALGAVLGLSLARFDVEQRRSRAAELIYYSVYEDIALALAAYGPATVPAAYKLGVTLRMALGPLLTLATSLSTPLKKIDAVEKGKSKDPPGSAIAVETQKARAVKVTAPANILVGGTPVVLSCGCVGACTCKSAATSVGKLESYEYVLTATDQIEESRRAIEAIAAFWVRRDIVMQLLRCGDVLVYPRVRPRLSGIGYSGTRVALSTSRAP